MHLRMQALRTGLELRRKCVCIGWFFDLLRMAILSTFGSYRGHVGRLVTMLTTDVGEVVTITSDLARLVTGRGQWGCVGFGVG